MSVVEAERLTKNYGRDAVAVRDVSFQVKSGEVYGLLGRNGAGKSTLMGMLLGLLAPTAGSFRLFGANARDQGRWRGKIGSLIEAPSFYPHLSGRRNLEVLSRLGGLDRAVVEDALDRVGLADASDHSYRKYSLGMKQRLGIAAAILGRPELIILDEPTNGLDPQSVAEVRRLIRELRSEGHTVLLSSHILSEVEQVVDRVGIMARGELVSEGTLEEISALQGPNTTVRLRVDDPDLTVTTLATVRGVSSVDRHEDRRLSVIVEHAEVESIGGILSAAGVTVMELYLDKPSLEDLFLQITDDAKVQVAS